MSNNDKKIISKLWKDGYVVMVNKLDGKTFTERYSVYQGCSKAHLKIVVVDNKGNVTALQG